MAVRGSTSKTTRRIFLDNRPPVPQPIDVELIFWERRRERATILDIAEVRILSRTVQLAPWSNPGWKEVTLLNAKQVQMWLAHHSPAFTLSVYVHLLPDDLPEPSFFDGLGGNTTHETGRNEPVTRKGETARILGAVRVA